MSKWQCYKIENTGLVVTGKTPSKNNPEDWGCLMPFITPSDYKNFLKKANRSDRGLSDEGITKLKNKVLPPKSVLVTCIGSDMGKVVMNDIEVITNQQINSIIPNPKIVHNDFLYYSLINMYETLRVYGGDGTAVPIINKGDFENLDILLPHLPEQKAIASVLSSLDDKIDLLHRQNKTLESLAETLFRKTFIEDAKPEWPKHQIGDFVEVMRGLSYKGAGLTEKGLGVPMHNLNSVYEGGGYKYEGIKYYSGDYKERHLVKPGDIIVTNTEQGHDLLLIGYPAIVPKYFGENGIFSQHIYKLAILNKKISELFLNYLLMAFDVREQVVGSTNGSTVNMLPKDGIEWATFRLPPQKLIDGFTEIANQYQSKKEINYIQIRTLEKLRDTLLPKLMTGEVKVDN